MTNWFDRKTTQLIMPNDEHFWKSIWKSSAFKELLNNNKDYQKVINYVKQFPLWLIEPQSEYEIKSFSIWFCNSLIKREYKNRFIHDLYIFHDLLHAYSFIDNPKSSFDNWKIRMRSNEISVSLETEVLLYLKNKSLRKYSFNKTIWSDIWLDKNKQIDLIEDANIWETNYMNDYENNLLDAKNNFHFKNVHPLEKHLWFARRFRTFHPQYETEKDFLKYEENSDAFYNLWKKEWKYIESNRIMFKKYTFNKQYDNAIATMKNFCSSNIDNNGVPFGYLFK